MVLQKCFVVFVMIVKAHSYRALGLAEILMLEWIQNQLTTQR